MLGMKENFDELLWLLGQTGVDVDGRNWVAGAVDGGTEGKVD